MYSRFSVLLASSFLFSASAVAGTTTLKKENVSAGASNDFEAEKGTEVTVEGAIVPTSEECIDVVPEVEMRLERRMGGKSYLVQAKTVRLGGSLSVAFTTPNKDEGVYRVTWSPKPNQSTRLRCTFHQDLEVTFTDP